MRLPEMLYRRPSISETGNSHNSHELPRFSFEGDDRPLISTERLFRQWSEDEETGRDPGFNAIGHVLKLEQDIIVGICLNTSTHISLTRTPDHLGWTK